ncbi:hypothetical protein BQ8420_14150 [Nocardiopsis sp. JB363]|nr:hypothetical protein BQ8420_14150 [Nocardiopsis sp. JB363]
MGDLGRRGDRGCAGPVPEIWGGERRRGRVVSTSGADGPEAAIHE